VTRPPMPIKTTQDLDFSDTGKFVPGPSRNRAHTLANAQPTKLDCSGDRTLCSGKRGRLGRLLCRCDRAKDPCTETQACPQLIRHATCSRACLMFSAVRGTLSTIGRDIAMELEL